MVSLSTCHVELVVWDGNLVKSDSSLTARFGPRWTVVVDASVATCILRINDINIASTTGNNVGTSSSFKEILAPG